VSARSSGTTYVALLRGINVGGNRTIAMPQLKAVFESLGFDGVKTYINSGNVIFRTGASDRTRLTSKIEKAIEADFGTPVAIVLRDLSDMEKLVAKIPDEWVTDKDWRCDVMFLWPEFDRKAVLKEFPINPDIEDVRYLPGAVVWHIAAKNVAKSRRGKMFGTPLYRGLSIRNVNTVRKLAELMRQAEEASLD
jgi:uncharacterized protein (DUF1697 family)